MPRTLAAYVLPPLAGLALLSPGRAVAGPSEEVSGKMVFVDKVADGLRRYRQEEEWEKRTQWLETLAPTRDPRVGVVLGELVEKYRAVGWMNAKMDRDIRLFNQYYGLKPPPAGKIRIDELDIAMCAWKAREVELRRRATQLPQ